ncbi:chitobiase/beta-hexosaminidase C-terminal domain-containing protein, partial [Escherichia coli]|nr:chitobiase/beta-hexosaminidase C-terminal domain-containing protein [Escherichia coli]
FQTTVLSVFDKLLFPGNNRGEDVLRPKALDSTYPSNEPYNGERQVVKTLTSDPIKLYTQINENFDALRARAESLLFGTLDEARKTDLLDKMKQKTQMPWLPSRGFDQLAIEAYQRGVWEDLGNGYITKKPKPKTTEVIISEDSSPDDAGTVRLKIGVANAGNSPRIHYAEDDEVTESSPVLSDNTLATKALRVQFLAVDPTGKNLTGNPTTWKNRLTLRNRFDEVARTVELFVAPRGTIKYTLDGSEARNGETYTVPIQLADQEATIYVFAECDGLEEKRNFTFAAAGSKEIPIIKDKPATLVSPSPKRMDSSAKTYEGLKIAKEKGIEFEQISLMVGSAPKVIHISLGEMKISAEFIETVLTHLQTVLSPEAPVVMTFKKAYTQTGHDLEQFVKQLGIEIGNGEVEQR